MKLYVYASAYACSDDVMDINYTKIFTTLTDALEHFEKSLSELTSEEGGWHLYSRSERHANLTDGDDEVVMMIEEHDI